MNIQKQNRIDFNQIAPLIVHIGLPKTATTAIQKNVFSYLNEQQILNFIDDTSYPNIISAINDQILGLKIGLAPDSNISKEILQIRRNSKRPCLISLEHLNGEDPSTWLEHFSLCNQIFGNNDVRILITFRSPKSYLISFYQQIIHQGEMGISIKDFYLRKPQYKNARRLLGELACGKRIFSIDDLDYEHLCKIYSKKFPLVVGSDMETTKKLDFFKLLKLDIKKEMIDNAQENLQNSKKENVSYSDISMTLTKKRNSFLEKIGLMDIGLYGNSFLSIKNILEKLESNQRKTQIREYYQTSQQNIVPKKDKHKFFPLISWRSFMQNCINKILPYKKWSPDKALVLFKDIITKNDSFYNKLPVVLENSKTIEK